MNVSCYIAELIFRIDNQKNPPLIRFEKQIRLLEAGSEKEAYQLALIAASKELDKHQDRFPYQWEFAGIELLHLTDHPEAVKEGCLPIAHPTNVQEYMYHLRQRNASLQSKLALSA